jgi:hypothetical protein
VRTGRGWGGTDDENVEVLVEDETEGEDAGRGDDAAHEVDIVGAQVPAQAWTALQLPGSIVAGPCLSSESSTSRRSGRSDSSGMRAPGWSAHQQQHQG